ncbi:MULTISPECIES: histidine kinase [Brevibacterium]|uniref:sensor histidine kinase n=1 Tax=Brevibacterium TaxID=1696 RepID=UPI000C788B7E|nr:MULTISPECIES: histidine kinase [Brevibacterium]HCG54749.1 two-component sensor histidine kinase [Brevibacterium sp.]
MTYHRGGNTLLHALFWTGVSLAVGVLILAIGVGAQWPDPQDAGAQAGALRAELFVHIAFGIVALACLPIVLLFDGRTIPRKTLRPKVLAAEKFRDFLTASGRGGEEFLAEDGSVESLQRRPGGWIPVAVGLLGILLGTISLLGAVAASALLITLSARRSWSLDFACLAVAIASQSMAYTLTPNAFGQFELPIFLVNGAVFAILVVIGVIRGAREQGLIDTAAQTLLRERSRQDRAVAEVRRGIARDMHDSLSHHLSVIAMYSGALSVRRDLDPESVHESARLIAASARRSGIELREVLTMLRGDDQGTVIDPDLERLIADRSDTVELTYTQPLTPEFLHSVGALERTTIYRFAQEAITNAVKHAPGQKLLLTLSWISELESVEMLAYNAHIAEAPTVAKAREQSLAGSGLGLLGLKERMEAMGGDLSVARTPAFELRARIPVPQLNEEIA